MESEIMPSLGSVSP